MKLVKKFQQTFPLKICVLFFIAFLIRIVGNGHGIVTNWDVAEYWADDSTGKYISVKWTNQDDEKQYNALVKSFEQSLIVCKKFAGSELTIREFPAAVKEIFRYYASKAYAKVIHPVPQHLYALWTIFLVVVWRMITLDYFGWIAMYFLTGRYLTALTSAITIFLAYYLYRKHLKQANDPKWLGWFIALIVAFLPAHVAQSHYITDNIISTLINWITFIFILNLVEKSSLPNLKFDRTLIKRLTYSGVLFGIGLATKWTILPLYGVLFLGLIVKGFINNGGKIKEGYKILIQSATLSFFVFGISLITYVITLLPVIVSHISMLNFNLAYYLKHILGEENVYREFSVVKAYVRYFSYTLTFGSGGAIFGFGLVGIFISIYRAIKQKVEISHVLLIIWFLIFVISAGRNVHGLNIERNLDVYMILAILCGIFIQSIWKLKLHRGSIYNGIVVVICCILIAFPMAFSLILDNFLVSNQNRKASSEWIQTNIPKGSKIMVLAPYGPFDFHPDIIRADKSNPIDGRYYQYIYPSLSPDWPKRTASVDFTKGWSFIDFYQQLNEIEKELRTGYYPERMIEFISNSDAQYIVTSDEILDRMNIYFSLSRKQMDAVMKKSGFQLTASFPTFKPFFGLPNFDITPTIEYLARSTGIFIYHKSSIAPETGSITVVN